MVVVKSGTRYYSWRGNVRGERIDVSLGATTLMSLDEAMEKAIHCKRRARNGKHPLRKKERSRRERRQDEGHTLARCMDLAI